MHFNKYPLLLAEIDDAVKPSDLDIYHLPIWARFYDIPFRGRGNVENAKILGNKLGEFLEVAKLSRYSFEKSMRVKVMLDVRCPLKDSVSLKIKGGQVCSIPVKNERLPMFCFFCGRLGHGSNECMDINGDESPEKKFGASLKASPWKATEEEKGSNGEGSDQDDGKNRGKRLFITKPKLDWNKIC